MLGKLLKYELKASGRIMLPLLLAVIAAGLALALNIKITDRMPNNPIILTIIFTLLFVAAVLGLIVMMIITILQRFYKNLLGEEGYLMFTLPVRTGEHIAAKAISALVWIVAGMAAGGLTGMGMIAVIGDYREFIETLQEVWNDLGVFLSDAKARTALFYLALIMVSGILEGILKVYAAMSVGQLAGGHRILGSIGAYLGFSVIETVLTNILARTGLLNTTIEWINEGNSYVINTRGVGAVVGIAIFGCLVYGLISWYMLDRHLNLE